MDTMAILSQYNEAIERARQLEYRLRTLSTCSETCDPATSQWREELIWLKLNQAYDDERRVGRELAQALMNDGRTQPRAGEGLAYQERQLSESAS